MQLYIDINQQYYKINATSLAFSLPYDGFTVDSCVVTFSLASAIHGASKLCLYTYSGCALTPTSTLQQFWAGLTGFR